jgi:hypothetical protein
MIHYQTILISILQQDIRAWQTLLLHCKCYNDMKLLAYLWMGAIVQCQKAPFEAAGSNLLDMTIFFAKENKT